MKIQEVTSIVVITVKNEKSCQTATEGHFQIFFSDIDGFTVEQSVQCDIQVVENIFVDDPK